MATTEISKQTARRYLLGKQGLWPGRRWQGKVGAREAIQQIESVQVDPVSLIGRNHDLVLWSRVAGYDPAHLDELLYTDRHFFDYGGILHIYPMSELPYWRVVTRKQGERFAKFLSEHKQAVNFVREELTKRGPLGNRDFEEKRTLSSYRSGKESGLALYYLWRSGELMTHSRRNFERIYYFTEQIANGHLHASEVQEHEAREFFAWKALRSMRLSTFQDVRARTTLMMHSYPDRAWMQKWIEGRVDNGEVEQIRVEDRKELYYLPASDLPTLQAVEAGQVPAEWRVQGRTTLEEANFIAPLDNLIWSRKGVQALFDFDYIWEIYKPAHQRRYGPYTMPILFGDRLVGRLNSKLDRKAGVLTVDGFWLEDEALANDWRFASALEAGLGNFARFHQAERIELAINLPGELSVASSQ